MNLTMDFSPKRIKVFNYAQDIKEVIEIDNVGHGNNGGRKGKKSNEVSATDREKNIKRIKRNCRRLALANDLCIHVMLTYKENMQDVEKSDQHFKKFIYDLHDTYPNLKYIATRELQKRGAVHYHILINQRVDIKVLNLAWNKQYVRRADHTLDGFRGWVDIVPHSNKLKAIMYVLKYIQKEVGEMIMTTKNGHTKKAYLSSQGLKQELDKCTLRYVIAEPEHYVVYQDRLNMMMSNLTEGWDISFDIDINAEKPIKGRSILRCAAEN